MKNSMFVGLAIGMVAGACIASNSYKTRQAVTEAQEKVKQKLCPQQDCTCGGADSDAQNVRNQ